MVLILHSFVPYELREISLSVSHCPYNQSNLLHAPAPLMRAPSLGGHPKWCPHKAGTPASTFRPQGKPYLLYAAAPYLKRPPRLLHLFFNPPSSIRHR